MTAIQNLWVNYLFTLNNCKLNDKIYLNSCYFGQYFSGSAKNVVFFLQLKFNLIHHMIFPSFPRESKLTFGIEIKTLVCMKP